MPVFWLALMMMYVFAVNFRRWGLPYLPTVGMYDPAVGKTPSELIQAYDPAGGHTGRSSALPATAASSAPACWRC